MRVLVVDDQEIFRSVLRDLVRATEGFRLVGDAASSEAALARMAALQPDFIVMDVCLGTGTASRPRARSSAATPIGSSC